MLRKRGVGKLLFGQQCYKGYLVKLTAIPNRLIFLTPALYLILLSTCCKIYNQNARIITVWAQSLRLGEENFRRKNHNPDFTDIKIGYIDMLSKKR